MAARQGDTALLDDPVARQLLQSTVPARLSYVWTDGSPRVVPIWFHWDGADIVLGSPPRAPKLLALARDPRVAVTIDSEGFPAKVLLVRGTARVDLLDDVSPEYEAAARRYLGEDAGRATVDFVRGAAHGMARIAIRPEWVGILDFETRWPSALAV